MKKILLVDDSSIQRKLVIQIIQKANFTHEILQAENGEDAIKILGRNFKDICLVLVDWSMPRMSGLEFIEGIAKVPALLSIPIIMISSEGTDEKLKQAKSAHPNLSGYLVKPFSASQLKELVAPILGGETEVQNVDSQAEQKDVKSDAAGETAVQEAQQEQKPPEVESAEDKPETPEEQAKPEARKEEKPPGVESTEEKTETIEGPTKQEDPQGEPPPEADSSEEKSATTDGSVKQEAQQEQKPPEVESAEDKPETPEEQAKPEAQKEEKPPGVEATEEKTEAIDEPNKGEDQKREHQVEIERSEVRSENIDGPEAVKKLDELIKQHKDKESKVHV